jgi:hypothetical protein
MRDKELEENSGDGLRGEISRRQWLMKLGEATVVFGLSGAAPEQQAKATALLAAMTAELEALPPGLYEPSGEHMARALTNDGPYVKVPAGSETDYVRPRQGTFRPLFFTDKEMQTMQQLVKLILGAQPEGTAQGDGAEHEQTIAEIAEWIDLQVSEAASVRETARQISPEHRALAVAFFGKESVEKLETDDPARVCRDGLQWLDERSKEVHGAPFLKLSEVEQREVAGSARNVNSPDREGAGSNFLAYLSSQTVLGFYSSRLGLNELGYRGNSFSVECPGCTPSG